MSNVVRLFDCFLLHSSACGENDIYALSLIPSLSHEHRAPIWASDSVNSDKEDIIVG